MTPPNLPALLRTLADKVESGELTWLPNTSIIVPRQDTPLGDPWDPDNLGLLAELRLTFGPPVRRATKLG
jgi:hypothetical protein